MDFSSAPFRVLSKKPHSWPLICVSQKFKKSNNNPVSVVA
jgi:hypothetical protein